jgi:predicted O-methyltransferase YrrM
VSDSLASFAEQYRARLEGPDTDIRAHLPLLYKTVLDYRKPQILELGTRRGESTRAFLAAAEANGGHVWSVDIEQPDVPAEEWAATGLWHLTVADDRDVPIPAGYRPDVVFIDTSHELLHTLAELERFVPLAAPGGTVLLHDTEFGWEPARMPPPGPVWFPVAAALDLYCYRHDLRWRNYYGSYGLGEIKIP